MSDRVSRVNTQSKHACPSHVPIASVDCRDDEGKEEQVEISDETVRTGSTIFAALVGSGVIGWLFRQFGLEPRVKKLETKAERMGTELTTLAKNNAKEHGEIESAMSEVKATTQLTHKAVSQVQEHLMNHHS